VLPSFEQSFLFTTRCRCEETLANELGYFNLYILLFTLSAYAVIHSETISRAERLNILSVVDDISRKLKQSFYVMHFPMF